MSIRDAFSRLISFSGAAEDEDVYYENYEEEDYDDYDSAQEEPEEPAPCRMRTARVDDRGDKVLSIHYPEEMKVVIVRPRKFDESMSIVDHIKERRTVVINLERTDKNISRRIMDFLSGAAYAVGGDFKRVAANTFMIVPKTVVVIGAEAADNENTAMYYESN